MKGKRLRTMYFEVRIVASPLVHARVGLVIPKYRHSAVARNRLKRRVREVVRVDILATLPAIDVVIRSQPKAYDLPFIALRADLRQIMSDVRTQLP